MPMPTYPNIGENGGTFPYNTLLEVSKFKHMPLEYHNLHDKYDNSLQHDVDVTKKADSCAGVPLSSPLFVLLCKRARGPLSFL